ncbi:uroporphyrinogen-III synthase [Mesobaculum littorinae]|uniref:Uroporphyrinogen-III synthase n=1 Tax=Mesobaculum littorinae TaxID=2486419 RepID=A0A438AH87_9RHOB|nr:uroporphyrinogen-III synthase [Mesobaculum littorinae]RVV97985.1 uroporphyrinogen-III synthase [Mesobaculum littorinae]
MSDVRPRLLLTRPDDAARRFAALCADALPPHVAVIAPLMRIQSLPEAVPGHEQGQEVEGGTAPAGLILSSAQAVQAIAGRADLLPLPVWTVGGATAHAARAAGFAAQAVAEDAETLIATLPGLRPATPLWHLHGRHTRGDVARRLCSAGLPTRGFMVYDQIAQPLPEAGRAALAGAAPVFWPLFSPRSATLAAMAVPAMAADTGARIHAVALSPAVAAAWEGAWEGTRRGSAECEIAESPDAQAMVAALIRLFQRQPGV